MYKIENRRFAARKFPISKKGAWGYPLNLVTYGILLAIILIFYGIIFFGFDSAKSEIPTISSSNYQDSTTLINLLKTKIEINNKNLTII